MRLGVLACAIVIACDPGQPVAVVESTSGFASGESSGGSPMGHGGAGGGGSASGGSASGGQSTTSSFGASSDEGSSEASSSGDVASDEGSSADTTGVDDAGQQTPMGEIPDVGLIAVSGFVEAGPFVAGSTVEIWALDSLGYPYALAAATEVTDDTGAFGPVDVPAAAVEVRAEGHYFDVVADAVSDAPLRLEVVAVANGKPIHVNVLGHVARPTILERLHDGYSIASAFSIETQTILGVLGSAVLGAAPPFLKLQPSALSMQGPDDRPSAFLLATTVVLQSATRVESPNDPTTAFQAFIDALAADEADLQITDNITTGPYAIDPDAVRTALHKYYQSAGLQTTPADLARVMDADDDWVWDIDDNCPTLSNEWQGDYDQDGIGDTCDCDMTSPDPDGDGWPSDCDSCPDVANAPFTDHFPGFWENPNWDFDEWGNACDSCPRSYGVGGVPQENCCDPRSYHCSATTPMSSELFMCAVQPSGDRFGCRSYNYCIPYYASSWIDMCADNSPPWLPAGGFPVTEECGEGEKCSTKWCTVGDDGPCNVGELDGVSCIPWWEPGDAPAGMDDFGICALANEGPCAGVVGQQCAQWVGQG